MDRELVRVQAVMDHSSMILRNDRVLLDVEASLSVPFDQLTERDYDLIRMAAFISVGNERFRRAQEPHP